MTRRSAFSYVVTAVVLAVSLLVTEVEAAEEMTPEEIAKVSIVELAPEFVLINRRYPKFYGDKTTVNGNILERTYLLGSMLGLRDKAVEEGIYFDAGLTQNEMWNAHGGIEDSSHPKYSSSLDLNLTLDSAKLTDGLWPGAMFYLHGEIGWGNPIQRRSGAGIPPVYDNTMPLATDTGEFRLSEAYLVQSLGEHLMIWAGKMNGAALVDGNRFANNERTQFLNTALVDNPILGAFSPYTPLDLAIIYMPTTEHMLIASLNDTNASVNNSGFNSWFEDPRGTTFLGAYMFLPEFDGMPGHYEIAGAYTNKEFTDYDLSNRLEVFRELLGVSTVNDESGNWVVLVNFDQFLYVADKEALTGVGIFGRGGWVPKDVNAIDQFYSFGIGGKGLLIPGRDRDTWGIGWAGSHFSSDLRDDLRDLGIDIKAWEHVVELFYNIEVTPWARLTPDIQFIIDPLGAHAAKGVKSVDSRHLAVVAGLRLQLDF